MNQVLNNSSPWAGWLLILIVLFAQCREGANPPITNPDGFSLTRGQGMLEWSTPDGATTEVLDVHYYVPLNEDIESMPILFVFHGAERNAGAYINAMKGLAETAGCILVAPNFSETDYPGSTGYQQGNLIAGASVRPEEEWLFHLIDPLFDEVLVRLGVLKPTYDVWGHSGGGQFVHRFMLLANEPRVRMGVAANAGWYTLPEDASEFPYGLGGIPRSQSDLGGAFSKPLVIHLGTLDNAFMDTPWTGAFAQGDNRFDRGHYFFNKVQAIALEEGLNCQWTLEEVEGVGHNYLEMASAAIDLLYP